MCLAGDDYLANGQEQERPCLSTETRADSYQENKSGFYKSAVENR